VIISENEDTHQRAPHELSNIILDYNFEISTQKTHTHKMAFYVKWHVILHYQSTEQVYKLNYLGCQLSYEGEAEVNHKLEKFNYMCSTLKQIP
jgi:hypothetical protein